MSRLRSARVSPAASSGRSAPWHRRRHGLAGFALAMPALGLFVLFSIYPIIQVFGLSLFDYNLTSPPVFVGLDNFAFLSTDPRFGTALSQTVFYAVATYGPALVLALLLAQALSTRIRGMGLVRLLYFLPLAMSWVAVSIIWRVILHPDGMLNQVLMIDVNWLTSSETARWGLVIMSVWKETAFFLILFLAGLSAIPTEIHEAARIDGAGFRQRFWHLTLPLLRPIIAVCTIMATLRGFQAFSPQAVLTNGSFGTEVVNLFVYKTAFEHARMGRASAVAVMMFVLLLGLALIQLRLLRRKD
jgi:ABC-type sugar transport system permease subunit